MFKRILSAVFVLGICSAALASDADLAQYNRPAANAEAANAADALLSTLLVVRDGKGITADSNGAGSAPVNRSIKELADALAGVRCSLIGNCASVNSRTLKSLHVDGTGGVTSSASAGNAIVSGNITAQTGNITASTGDVIATTGNVRAGSDVIATANLRGTSAFVAAITGVFSGGQAIIDSVVRVGLSDLAALTGPKLSFTATTTSSVGSNPPQGTSLKNRLAAKNIVKHWMRASGTGGSVSFQDGAGNWLASIVDAGAGAIPIRYRIRFTMGDAMDSTGYAVVCTWNGISSVPPIFSMVMTDTQSTTVFDVTGYSITLPGFLPLNTSTFDVSCLVMGQQTT